MNVLVLNITAAAEMGVNGTCVLRKQTNFPPSNFSFFMLSKTCPAFYSRENICNGRRLFAQNGDSKIEMCHKFLFLVYERLTILTLVKN